MPPIKPEKDDTPTEISMPDPMPSSASTPEPDASPVPDTTEPSTPAPEAVIPTPTDVPPTPTDTELANEAVPTVAEPVTSEAPLIIPPEPPQAPEKIALTDSIADDDAAATAAPGTQIGPSQPTTTPDTGGLGDAIRSRATLDAATTGAQTEAAVSSMPPMPIKAPSDGKKKKKLLIIGGIVAAVIVLLAGSALAFIKVIAPNEPKYVVLQSLANTIFDDKLQDATFTGTSTITDTTSKASYAVDYDGQFGQGGKLDATISVGAGTTKVALEGLTADGKNYYVKVSGLQNLPTLLSALTANSASGQADAGVVTALAPALGSINNQWYEINQSLVQTLESKEKLNQMGLQLSPADASVVKSLYRKHSFMVVDKTLPDQTIAGQLSYHYSMHIDSKVLQTFLTDAHQANLKTFQISAKDVSDFSGTNFSKYPFELWISHQGKLIDQVKLASTTSDSTVLNQVTLSKLNQPVSITAPANSQSIVQLITGLYQSLTGSSSAAASAGVDQLLGGS